MRNRRSQYSFGDAADVRVDARGDARADARAAAKAKDSRPVSGHRFSDAERGSPQAAPLGAGMAADA